MSMRIVFMGTPDFAAESLRALLDSGFEVCAVFTQPDKPRDRGMKECFSPVKELALSRGLRVCQPATLRGGEAAETLRELRADLLVVVAYGKLLPDDVLAVPPLGAINVHGSLLPAYRGAAPIQWSVLNGDQSTGVTTMYLAHDMDAGDIIYQSETPIGEYETAGELFDRLALLGAELLVRTLRDIEAGTAPRVPQDHSRATYVKQLDKSVCPIDWNKTPREIVKHVCGLSPWPTATTVLDGAEVKVWRAEYTQSRTDMSPGSVVSAGKQGVEIACAGGETLMITELQAAGKKRMRASDWLLGHPIRL